MTSVAFRDLLKGNDECVCVRTVAFFLKCTQIIYTELDRTVDKAEYERGDQRSNWIGAYLESSTKILLIIGGMMYYITYILTVTTCFGFQH